MQFATLFAFALTVVSVNGAPFVKRIAQTIADSTTQWEQACDTAGGGDQCNPVAVAAFGTLLAAPGPCAQQDAADSMIDLAKTLNNDPDMIKFAQIFAQQPRNSPSSQAVPYCQSAPKNSELNGLYQCQWQGDDLKTFVGGIAVGGNGTIPFGMSSPLSPAGSCPANPSGPIANGVQLVTLTQNPGVGSSSNSTSSGSSSNSTSSASGSSTATSSASSSTSTSTTDSSDDCDGDDDEPSGTSSSAPTGSSTSAAPSASASSSGSFLLSNGQAAQKLNSQFASLTSSSSCTAGENACVNGSFAQCVSGSFVLQSCGSGLTCAALPLVNSAGTSITCTTTSDAEARISATGATGGLTGSASS
ncbi:hypothetical protein BV22DRAFT_1032919 [Leucogyrophana mollusca]|uniref:Uncharacterized protein n=1 Tax=Leucogyrophana mollusca TaxID=85980 RepID=A0ACB8BPD1_9AGAM|nr:hypothetical protein BV22DRAFT_1032919 [Leucogyrophana mollusca]